MNVGRFLRKCVTDYPAAVRSAKLVAREYYGRWYWRLRYEPLAYHLPTGGVLLLEPGHAFTGCFWPDVDRYEPEVCAFLRRVLKPGATFIDCGANVGYFSINYPLVYDRGKPEPKFDPVAALAAKGICGLRQSWFKRTIAQDLDLGRMSNPGNTN